jgi:hypothetical protein
LNEIFDEYRQNDIIYSDYRLLENKWIMIKGLKNLPVNREVFECTYNNERSRILAWKIIKDDALYNILFYSTPEAFDKYIAVVENMIKTLRFTDSVGIYKSNGPEPPPLRRDLPHPRPK